MLRQYPSLPLYKLTRPLVLATVGVALAAATPIRAWADDSKAQPAKEESRREVPAKDSAKYLAAFKGAVTKVSQSTVRVQGDGKDLALGAIVGPEGWIITKASELKGVITCQLRDGRRLEARLVGVHEPNDLAMLKVEAKDLTPVDWLESKNVQPGNFLVTPGPKEEAVAVGIVSVATRTMSAREAGPANPTKGGFLGISVADGNPDSKEVRVADLVPNGPASKIGFKRGDIILSVNGKTITNMDSLTGMLQNLNPGDKVKVKLKRGEEELDMEVTLDKRQAQGADALGGNMSTRRGAFRTVLQHDTILRPQDCGGPVVNLDGKTIGINIARSGRVETLALPSELVLAVLNDLESGKLAPPELTAEEKAVEAAKAVVKQAEAKLVDAEKDLAKARKALEEAEAKAKAGKKDGK